MKHGLWLTCTLVLLFLAAQYIGLGIANSYIDYKTTEETGNFTVYDLPAVAGMEMSRPELEEETSWLYIIGAVLVGTVLILLLIKWGRINIWKVWFLLAVTVCLTAAFGSFLPVIAANILGIGLALWKVIKPNFYIHNITELFIYGGLCAIFFPVLSIPAAALLLLAISAYDMYAVWRSKHMVKLADFQKDTGLFAGLVLPYRKGQSLAPPKTVKQTSGGSDARTAVLGGGDIGFPLLFAAAVLKTAGFLSAAIIPPFAALALLLLLVYAKKDRYYPAMPFISAGCAVGFLVAYALPFIL